jgi:hypothetical protein
LSDSGSAMRGTNTTNNVTSKIPSALSGGRGRGSGSGGNSSGGDTVVNIQIDGNELINDRELNRRISQAGNKRGRHFR